MANKKTRVLRLSRDFQNIKNKGKRFVAARWLLVAYMKNDVGYMRFGWTVPGKIGPAVIRNKLKRWCREYFRQILKSGSEFEVDINVVIRPVDDEFFKKLHYEEFKKSMDSFFKAGRVRS